MPGPRKTGTQRGGNKKPAGEKQGRSGARKTTNLTVIAGGKAPAKAPATPKAPVKLGRTAAGVWRTFWKSPLAETIEESDLYALRRWIAQVQEYETLMAEASEKTMVSGSQGQPRLNPLFARIEKLEQQIANAEQQFGMTPLARMKLGIAFVDNAESADKLNELIAKRRADAADDHQAKAEEATGKEADAEFESEFTAG